MPTTTSPQLAAFHRLALEKDRDTIALGTLRLDSVILIQQQEEEQHNPVASTSSSTIQWKVYTPGILQDAVDIEMDERRRGKGHCLAATGVSPTSGSPRKSSTSTSTSKGSKVFGQRGRKGAASSSVSQNKKKRSIANNTTTSFQPVSPIPPDYDSTRNHGKRKRSASFSSSDIDDADTHTNANTSASANGNGFLGNVPLPTLRELDHLVKNTFIFVEYAFIDEHNEDRNDAGRLNSVAHSAPISAHESCTVSIKMEVDENFYQAPVESCQNGTDYRSEPTNSLPNVTSHAHQSVSSQSQHFSMSSCSFRIYAIPLDTPGLNQKIEASKLQKIRSHGTKALAQKTFNKLLHHLHCDEMEWRYGRRSSERRPASDKFLLPRNPGAVSILEVYNKLEDPKPRRLQGLSVQAQNVLDDILNEDAPEGMSSRLYDFQKTCLWKLASRELFPQRQIDLSFREHASADGSKKRYYIDSHMMIWNTAQYYQEPKAAIVSEGMGTGKTCICLALVLVTKHQLADIDDVQRDAFSRVTTRRTRRSEKFPRIRRAEDDVGDMDGDEQVDSMPFEASRTLKTVPSLCDLTMDLMLCSTHIRNLQFRGKENFVPTNADLPYVWEIPTPKGRDDTRSMTASRQKIYISATTLVIVPDILVAQWLAEIHKHIKEGALDYMKLEKEDHVPCSAELCKLDLVLVSESKIRAEESRFWVNVAPPCRCPYIGNTRVVACKCKKIIDHGISPLVGVWWKRLIVDEGHKVAGNGDLVQMCMRLRTESRYVVSGTPSKNLVGLHDVGTVEEAHQTESSAEGDKGDFERLARICNFIGMQPFCDDANLFMRAFHEPYKMRGDTSGIEAFFARTMVRHRVPDVAMPPLTRSTIVLEFNELERITYNVLLALFVSNSVTSERQDEDYFFHPRNKGALSTLLSNLGAAHLLFSSSELVKSANDSFTTNTRAIAQNDLRHVSQRWSVEDRELIDAAQRCFQAAFDDPLWRAAQKGSMLYTMERREISPDLLRVYEGFDLAEQATTAFTGERLTHLRYHIGKLARDPDWSLRSSDEMEEELITIAQKEQHRIIEENRQRDLARKLGSKAPKRKRARSVNKDSISPGKAAADSFRKATGNSKDVFTYEHLPLTCHLDQALIPSIASTKVSYVVKSILAHPNEKFLIFAGGSSSSSTVVSNNLFYLAEALDLADIPFLIFARTLSQEKLAAYARAFSESPAFRVLLLDLKFAGRGLTLSKATRIIFTEPVWHKDEEAQAVKRAHRLGQDKAVHVETLVMKDSFEEKVSRRGAQMSRREAAGAKTPYQDTQLSAALRGLTFLPERQSGRPMLFTALQPSLRLIPQHLHDTERHNLDIELARFRQQAQEDLAIQLENHSRGGSAARSRSGTPVPTQKRSASATPSLAQTASLEEDLLQTILQTTALKRAAKPPPPASKPRPDAQHGVAIKDEKASTDILMSLAPRRPAEDLSEDEIIVVASKTARPAVRFA